ncbi:MAG: V-type ATP synthase subunit I, partial [Eubacteriales bacterium]|nr:V-type ATP synthase subunit I [Eubacteriales bacterium]
LPWRGFLLAPDEVHSTRNTVAMLGTVPKSALEQWQADGTLGELCDIEAVSVQHDQVYVYVFLHRSCENEILQKLKDAGFAAVTLPPSPLAADDQLTELNAAQVEIDAKLCNVAGRTTVLAGDLDTLKQLYDLLQSRRARLLAAGHFSVSERTFFLQGWVPAPMIETIERRLHKVSTTVALEFYDPEAGEEPPVLLSNPTAVKPFESVVTGYSMPSPNGIDPTMVMTPFFINFMGMMISDAGYGLMLAILIPLMIKFLKPAPGTRRMMWLLAAGGVATVFWGAMYNSWFGFAPLPAVFDPMNNALPVMGVCIALGAVHLFTGLGVAAYMNVKRGKPLDAVADQLSWFLLVVGLGLMLVAPGVGKWMALTGAGIILVTAGRAKSKNPFKRLLSGLGALYGTTSWISDLLSYMRLFGMGLSTGVIGMVINILVAMVFSAGPVFWPIGAVLFVGGHLFNLAINTLGAYVHSCRLQYIEFFGKFYEDGGKPFTPLAETNRYVYVTETRAHS